MRCRRGFGCREGRLAGLSAGFEVERLQPLGHVAKLEAFLDEGVAGFGHALRFLRVGQQVIDGLGKGARIGVVLDEEAVFPVGDHFRVAVALGGDERDPRRHGLIVDAGQRLLPLRAADEHVAEQEVMRDFLRRNEFREHDAVAVRGGQAVKQPDVAVDAVVAEPFPAHDDQRGVGMARQHVAHGLDQHVGPFLKLSRPM